MSVTTSRLNVLIARLERMAARDPAVAIKYVGHGEAGFRVAASRAADTARTFTDSAAALSELRNLRLLGS
jgi:hypothetical protein